MKFDIPVEDISVWWERLEVDNRFYPVLHAIDRGWGEIIYPECTIPIIYRFDGTENRFLSNFYPFEIEVNGLKYATSEHYYQSMKPIEGSVDENGQLWSEKIRLADTPGKTKKLGRLCPLKPDWEQIKFRIMKTALIYKFKGTELEQRLLDTGNSYLVEGNVWHDCTFGICIKKDCERCKDKIGLNRLGLFLMELRDIIRKQNSED